MKKKGKNLRFHQKTKKQKKKKHQAWLQDVVPSLPALGPLGRGGLFSLLDCSRMGMRSSAGEKGAAELPRVCAREAADRPSADDGGVEG